MALVSFAADVVQITYSGSQVKIVNKIKDVKISCDGAHVTIDNPVTDREITFMLKGQSDNGNLLYNGVHKATFVLSGLTLSTEDGACMHFRCGKKIKIKAEKGTVNTLTDGLDTLHKACVHIKDNGKISGKGILNLNARADGSKGIKCGGNLIIEDVTLTVTTTGNYRSEGHPDFMMMGQPQGEGGFPPMPEGFSPDSMMMGGFPMMGPPMGGPGGGGGGGRHFYEGTAKAVKVGDTLTVNSGVIKIYTQSGGAEGLEGKSGVIINGGDVFIKAQDDAINSNGKIIFNGGKTVAWSRGNDAVDSNYRGEGAITITGGEVYAISQLGPPDEGFDCDFSPMIMTGGTAFSMGGSMGFNVTSPKKTDSCPPYLVMQAMNLQEGKTLQVLDEDGSSVFSYRIPFSMQQSFGFVSCSKMLKDKVYHISIVPAKL